MTREPSLEPTPRSKRTAVIYFHGMGEQKRYEEISGFVEALHDYARAYPDTAGELHEITARVEPQAEVLGSPSEVAFLRVKHLSKDSAEEPQSRWYQFYEVYWAPVMAGGAPWRGVVWWLLRQIPTPFKMLRSPWRSRQRLRRSCLRSHLESHPEDAKLVKSLLLDYADFDEPEARLQYPDGSFEEFLRFIEHDRKHAPEAVQELHRLARAWRGEYFRDEWWAAFVLAGVGLTVVIAAAAAAFLVVLALDAVLASSVAQQGWVGSIREYLVPSVATVGGALAFLVSALGIGAFLRNFLGDVYYWTTYEETDTKHQKREEVLKRGREVLTHVLHQPDVDRVIVAGHSLGTAVAVDTLLSLARSERAEVSRGEGAAEPLLPKVDIFLTWGSPVDKIHYFFESYQSRSYRYSRTVEELRGDLETPPFAKNRKPHAHWINFWDPADIIGGPLTTPCSAVNVALSVDNVQVQNLWFPNPGTSHTAYWKNAQVVRVLYEAIFLGQHSFKDSPVEDGRPNYAARRLHRVAKRRFVRGVHTACLAMPWLILGGALTYPLENRWAFRGFAGAAILIAAGIVLSWASGRAKGVRHPFRGRAVERS